MLSIKPEAPNSENPGEITGENFVYIADFQEGPIWINRHRSIFTNSLKFDERISIEDFKSVFRSVSGE